MKRKTDAPDRGDIVWLQFSPRRGHEQDGRRPALTVSPKVYNEKTDLALFCPITSRIKNYPFEVELSGDLPVSGAVLTDQIKSLDWRARKAERIGKVPAGVMSEVLAKLAALVT
ncbi:MAG: endoribonuclease MazF [Desulfobacterales bacterium]|nr:endoribonuclease MazF [Desulfobacterales bacterium]